jgi:hypothetical protein
MIVIWLLASNVPRKPSVSPDWTGDRSIFFRIIVSDAASRPEGLHTQRTCLSDYMKNEVDRRKRLSHVAQELALLWGRRFRLPTDFFTASHGRASDQSRARQQADQ